jgi:hypothetical protein
MPIFARFLTFYSEQYDESYVFKNVVFRSIYSIANLACLWAIIWYSSMLKTRPKESGAMRVATSEVHTESKKVPRTTKTQTEKQNSGRKAALNKLLVLREQKRKSKSKKWVHEFWCWWCDVMLLCLQPDHPITCQVSNLYTTCMYFVYVCVLVCWQEIWKKSFPWVGNIKMQI